ncbi:MAG TPA: site-2 protease family protein, partial [Ilumatobacteraceae bacterium]|nr:site-2 protease family protein [Ilumatobacteraceae bacterium]
MGMNTFKQEVVSGGTQKPLVDGEPPETLNPVLGIGVWVALFVGLFLYNPWAFVVAVGIAVSIIAHEFGHYWTARKSGMKVTQFFLGFGPRIWSTHRNGVEYGVRVIP